MKDDAQERAVDLEFAVVGNKPELAEAIHKEVDPRAGGTHNLGQSFLAYFGDHGLRRAFLAELCKQQQGPSQTLLAGIKELIHQILLDAKVAGQQVGNENIREFMFLVERAHHLTAVDPE